MAKKKKMAPLLPVFVLFFFYTTCGFSASEMPPAVSCCVSLRGLASLKRTLTGCWINGCGINKGWGTICGFFFFFLWHPLCMMSFQNRFIECCLVKLLRHVCISGQWRCFMAECGVYSSVCMNNAHILFFFTSCSLFIYQLRRPAALRVYKQPLSHPPLVLVFCEDAESKKQALEIQPTFRPDVLCL